VNGRRRQSDDFRNCQEATKDFGGIWVKCVRS
jgi:hypothetical protein